ncbi:uncharacterized protein AC631_01788 [Debaryomyces fabryi]|uniref:Uncharacterized protein n=1 Tax=Debaryomyces fabryi TaxID=58627 RepID=A0A0V1Q1T3_9ASCO|nr:uncharacterized protein AC631_01788 [Debaryomyces fabryi]KSA02419.1 hypothetical protein AC631_01788 [Debaryomyces fabryi]CUM54755.1 unnamed protein product [Debaryomyces fabryi]
MKFSSCLALPLLVSSVWATKNDAAVYQLNSQESSKAPVVTNKDVLLYLSDRFDISDYYKIGDNRDEVIEFIDQQNELINSKNTDNAKLLVLINGVSNPNEVFQSIKPAFKIKGSNGYLIHSIMTKFPKQIATIGNYSYIPLTNEIRLVSKHHQDNSLLKHFEYFNEKLVGIWNSFTKTVETDNQIILTNKVHQDATTLKLINDKLFINELSQLVHLNAVAPNSGDSMFINLNSLFSLGKKTGYDSETYNLSVKVLSDYLVALSAKYDISVIALPVDNNNKHLSNHLQKRGQELNEIFKESNVNKRASNNGVCFSSEDACKVGTSSCNSHGKCAKVKSGCWSCVCAATLNEAKTKTTNWSGYDCSKKDVSSEANLLLWTTLALLILFIGGIKLLYSVGNESLPGVLGAATVSKKSQ